MRMRTGINGIVLIILIMLVQPVYAQEVGRGGGDDGGGRSVDRLVIPFDAANSTAESPSLYPFQHRHVANWIVTISNNLIYNPENSDAKVVLRFRNALNTDEFLELGMTGHDRVLWFAVSKESVGYLVMYRNSDAWFPDKGIMMTYAQGERLSVNNGQRIVVDRLNIEQFAIDGVEVYGRDDIQDRGSALAGVITIEVISGNPLDNPIMSVPFIVTGAVAGIVLILLRFKRRDKDTN
ncbi:MAG: hypothetical protein NZ888_01510 [Candidatus Nitrosocaldus sp.]|nr:hypothetical protein [Candidatus Nitrosocaldus sp.]MDW7999775.1 hypothetical protein [Candidatus Nitrosocaldus sp.]